MFKHNVWAGVAALALFAGAPGFADVDDDGDGRASLDSVVPSGARNARSGAPAAWPEAVIDNGNYGTFFVDRLEYGDPAGPNNYVWDIQAWYGGDTHKLRFKTEGEGVFSDGAPEDVEFQTLYSRTVSAFWDVVAGARYDLEPEPKRSFAVLGLQGLAPYQFETDLAIFLGDRGNVSFRGEFEYEILFTQRLILQPRLEINAAASDTPEYGRAAGLTDLETGLRLRYEIRREFAPYIGIRHERSLGATRGLQRAEGEDTESTALVLGIRAWY